LTFSDDLSEDTPLTGLEIAPRLDNLTLNIITLESPARFADVIKLPWAQLQRLTVELDSIEAVLLVFKICETLIWLKLESGGRDVDPVDKQDWNIQAHHQSLTSLTLSDSELLVPVALPFLEKLSIDGRFYDSDLGLLHRFLVPSQSRLHELDLQFDVMTTGFSQDFIDLLESLHNLISLTLTFSNGLHASVALPLISQLLSVGGGEDKKDALSCLERVIVKADISDTASDERDELIDEIIEMIDFPWEDYLHRRSKGSSLDIQFGILGLPGMVYPLPIPERPRFEKLREDGLDFSIWCRAVDDPGKSFQS
jgi:hypothetical protein